MYMCENVMVYTYMCVHMCEECYVFENVVWYKSMCMNCVHMSVTVCVYSCDCVCANIYMCKCVL